VRAVAEFEIHISDTASVEDSAALVDALHAYNFDATGYRDGRALSCFLRDADQRLVAGLDGFTWGGYAKVDFLWVSETWRGSGLGTRLLAAAEAEAKARGCRTIVLDSHEFQAPDLYRRLGYEEVGVSVDTPIGFRQFFFQKVLERTR
jgi:ribosomal protein S18 acetylase RimI-like enzyme